MLLDELDRSKRWLMRTDAGKGLVLQLETLQQLRPDFFACIDSDRLDPDDSFGVLQELSSHPTDFEDSAVGGRGDTYRNAQSDPLVRSTGISTLFECAFPKHASHDRILLDALGGDGVVTRALARLLPPNKMPQILTSDVSRSMVLAAQAYGLPSIQQSATNLMLKAECMDAVLLAYGTHHIPDERRLAACQEANRVLKPGGRVVLHDFELDSCTATWFANVVDRYSVVPHQYRHFTAEEILGYLRDASFEHVTVEYIYDPLIVRTVSAEAALADLGAYLIQMYGLRKFQPDSESAQRAASLGHLAEQIFEIDRLPSATGQPIGPSKVQIHKMGSGWAIEMPRVAIVGTGRKREVPHA